MPTSSSLNPSDVTTTNQMTPPFMNKYHSMGDKIAEDNFFCRDYQEKRYQHNPSPSLESSPLQLSLP